MTHDLIIRSLQGIRQEIKQRQRFLSRMRSWLTGKQTKCDNTSFNGMLPFYASGLRISHELKLLKLIKLDLTQLLHMSNSINTNPKKLKKNAFICANLHATITEDIDEGVTPMFIPCEGCAAIGIENAARTQMYMVDQTFDATHEWYKPKHEELPALRAEWGVQFDSIMTHLNKGGLLLRKRKTTNLWLPGK